ncbi:AN1 zinc finger protein [Histoplasma capsulatum G186AR]|uniref:AN1 zinc finger protein n=1 Tax=Ajellomyces capsulatus TaxID=5037 RepID=A0A8H7Z8M7_AJECA|nr:AN1 zinc finger protein [Histoplasma capsulatum]QSS68853.1 AN1 zinc finger protein [Histoplasma capsulatum G186AR]
MFRRRRPSRKPNIAHSVPFFTLDINSRISPLSSTNKPIVIIPSHPLPLSRSILPGTHLRPRLLYTLSVPAPFLLSHKSNAWRHGSRSNILIPPN